MKFIFLTFSIIFLVYLILPGPSSISDFKALPNSEKSKLEGDTIQVPNITAYYSNNYRDFVTKFYQQALQSNTKFPFPPIRLNYPPEFAFTAIKDQTQATYLEEYVYPFRESIFVNGMEPFYESDKKAKFAGATFFEQDKKLFETKTTLRYYPSSIMHRLTVWMGVNISLVGLWVVGRKVLNVRS